MSKRVALFAVVMLVVAAILPAWASDAIKINGTVTKQGGDTITVTVDTNSVDVTLLPTTKYTVRGKAVKREDLLVGDTVSAAVTKVGAQWQASVVKITHPKKKP